MNEKLLEYFNEIEKIHGWWEGDAIARRLLSVARDPFAETASINVSDGDSSTDIVFGDRILMSVLDRDAQPLGRTRQELAEEYAGKMRRGV